MVRAQHREDIARLQHLVRAAVAERADRLIYQQRPIWTEKVGGPFDHACQPTHG